MSDTKYWDDYYERWDRFVKEWFEQRKAGYTIPQDKISKAYKNAVSGLEFDELPTPYLGNPRDGVDAVIINLNPGLSEIIRFREFLGENSDKTQYFSNRGKPLGWLIDEFENKAKGEYSKFIGIDSEINWSCLNPALLDTKKYPRWVCGVDWWQGYDDKLIVKGVSGQRHADQRMPWIRRMYGKSICPSKVFSLELCPYHSKEFKSGGFKREIVKEINDHVILPAIHAAAENGLDFVLAIGAKVHTALDRIRKFKFAEIILEDEWSYARSGFSVSAPRSCWPPDEKEKDEFRTRNYSLYKVVADDGCKARILVTWAQGGLSAPAEDFKDVERVILKYIKDNPL